MRVLAVAMCVGLACIADCGARSELGAVVAAHDASSPVHDASPDVAARDVVEEDVTTVTLCPPASTPVLLASGIQPSYDSRLAVDDTSVYMGDGQRVTRFPKCAPGAPQTLTGVEPNVGRVLVDGGVVYFLDIDIGGSVKSVPIGGGPTTTLATIDPQSQPVDLQKVGANVFYLAYGMGPSGGAPGLYTVPASGGSSTMLDEHAIGSDIAVDGTHVYFFGMLPPSMTPELLSLPLGGGTPQLVGGGFYQGDIAVDATNVYFTEYGVSSNLLSASKTGGAATAIASGEVNADNIIPDGGSVYWVNDGGPVQRVATTGGTPEVLVTTGVAGIGLDATSLYYSTYGGDLYRMDKP